MGVALNQGGCGFPLTPVGVRALAEGEMAIPAGTRVRLGEPAEEPVELLERLARALATTPATEARRAWAQTGDDVPGLVVGVATPDGELAPAVTAAVEQAVQGSGAWFAVDLVPLTGDDVYSAWMLEHATPFYRR